MAAETRTARVASRSSAAAGGASQTRCRRRAWRVPDTITAHPGDRIILWHGLDGFRMTDTVPFLKEGLERGEVTVLGATPECQRDFRTALEAAGVDWGYASASGHLIASAGSRTTERCDELALFT